MQKKQQQDKHLSFSVAHSGQISQDLSRLAFGMLSVKSMVAKAPGFPAGSAKTLILHEQDRQAVSQIERDPESLSTIDVAAFAFDSSSVDSFREAHDMLLRCAHASGNSMPCVLVAVESGKGMQEV